MFYKIVLDGMVIDVVDGLNYVKYQERNGLTLLGSEADAYGILSSDSSTIWHVEGLQDPPAGFTGATVSAVEIEAEEAEELRRQLEEGNPVENPEKPDEGDGTAPEPPQEEVMTPVEMRQKIKELTATVEELTDHNAMLEECLLEMSAIVYA